jgi:hypothetical protein
MANKDCEFDVFVSFAESDRELALKLVALFKAVQMKAFFAPVELPKNSPEDWEKGILEKGLKKSRCFVPIFTKTSINRKWVLFEAGAAAALKLPIFATRVEGIEDREIREFPYATRLQNFKLFSPDSLRELLVAVATSKCKPEHLEQKREQIRGKWDDLFENRRELINKFLCEARKRWIFIAGNIPTEISIDKTILDEQIQLFVKHLTINLLRSGFNLSACPQVQPVGGVVLRNAETFMAEKDSCTMGGCEVDYEIAGIHPIDKNPNFTDLSNKKAINRWHNHLLLYRRSYLENKDWLIVLGGNDGTKDEFDVVHSINESKLHHDIKVCFIPCFGGTAKKLNEDRSIFKNKKLYIDGCKNWKESEGFEKLAENVASIIGAG